METSKMYKKNDSNSINSSRNYQIDFLKFFLSVLVFFSHTMHFLPQYTSGNADETLLIFHHILGYVSVMCFFVISGFLMMKTLTKKDFDHNNAGKESINFVIEKFKKLALPFWISSAMYLCAFVLMYVYIIFTAKNISLGVLADDVSKPADLIINAIPQMFCISNSGELLYHGNNGPTWYISSMLLVMIPICYLLIRKRDLFVYVMSPLIAIIALGYLKTSYAPLGLESGTVRLIRACCGLCFGILSWTIYNKICVLPDKRSLCIAMTIFEIVLYLSFFAGVFTCSPNSGQIFPLMFLFPIALAITFSGKSYLHKFFKSKLLKNLGSLSLYVYLNHYLAICAVRALFDGRGYWFCTLIAAVLTVILCGVCYLGVVIIKKIAKQVGCKNVK